MEDMQAYILRLEGSTMEIKEKRVNLHKPSKILLETTTSVFK
uniref:Uncharacterized protein n=1 Tax=Arundo donax TaxID=35708 RepID=A0A0A8ZJ37_ARUDO